MPEHIFHIERLSSVTIRDYQPDKLKEHASEAWTVVATLTSDKSLWRVFDEWFDTIPEDEKAAGQYRVVEPPISDLGVGQYSPHVVKPSWSVEVGPCQPRPVGTGEETGLAQVA